MAAANAGEPAPEGGGETPTGALPDFVIIGAQKGGTTTLYRLLAGHPSVRPAVRKELHYFSVHYARGVEWYRGCFPAAGGGITGEGSPYYLFHPHAPARMAETVPGARLIAMLRNPVDRAYSHYQMVANMGKEPLAFEAALEAEGERLRGERERMLAEEHYFSLNHQYYSYLSRGVYADQLPSWSGFLDEGRMLVIKSEDFFERPMEILRRVLRFLGLREWEPQGWEVFLKGAYGREMSPQTRRRLEEYFEPHNRRLYEYLGRDLGW